MASVRAIDIHIAFEVVAQPLLLPVGALEKHESADFDRHIPGRHPCGEQLVPRATPHVDNIAVRPCAGTRPDGAEPCVIEVPDILAEEPAVKLHGPPRVEHPAERLVAHGEIGTEGKAHAVPRDGIHRVGARLEQSVGFQDAHRVAPGAQHFLPVKVSGQVEIAVVLETRSQRGRVARDVVRRAQPAKSHFGGVQLTALGAGGKTRGGCMGRGGCH